MRSIMPAMALPTSVSGPPRQAPGIGREAAAWDTGASKLLRCTNPTDLACAVRAVLAGAVLAGRASA
jgi:hypothetical protein